MPRSLFVWLEGDFDEDFFNGVFRPLMCNRYASIKTNTYAQRPATSTEKKIREVIRSHAVLDYLWLTDLDPKRFPCVTARKDAVMRQHAHLRPDRISIVVPEIEAWYLAGLDQRGVYGAWHTRVWKHRWANQRGLSKTYA